MYLGTTIASLLFTESSQGLQNLVNARRAHQPSTEAHTASQASNLQEPVLFAID